MFNVNWGEVRGYTLHLASWHNPKSMCWLWSLTAYLSVADEMRAFRAFAIPGPQARYVMQVWALNIDFTWQAEGRYRSPKHERQSALAKAIGVKL